MSLGVLSLLLLATAQTPSPSPLAPPARASSTDAAASTPPARQAPAAPEVDANVTWKGTTSQGREIEIQVEGNNLKSLRVSWRISFENLCQAPDTRLPQRNREGVHVMRYQYPEPVRAGHMKTRLGVGSDLDLSLEGTFLPDGTASGDFDLATVDGARCTGKLKATWKASQQ